MILFPFFSVPSYAEFCQPLSCRFNLIPQPEEKYKEKDNTKAIEALAAKENKRFAASLLLALTRMGRPRTVYDSFPSMDEFCPKLTLQMLAKEVLHWMSAPQDSPSEEFLARISGGIDELYLVWNEKALLNKENSVVPADKSDNLEIKDCGELKDSDSKKVQ